MRSGRAAREPDEGTRAPFLSRLFLSASPAQSLAETWVVGLLLLWSLTELLPNLARFATTNGLLFVLGTCGMWCVLRTRLPAGRWSRQFSWELLVATLLGGVMAAGLLLPAQLWPRWAERILTLASYNGGSLILTALFAATGAGYFFTRGVLRLLLFWNRLRRQHLLWAITNVHLVLVAAVVLVVALGMALVAPYTRVSPTVSEQPVGWVTTYLARFIVTVLPTIGVFCCAWRGCAGCSSPALRPAVVFHCPDHHPAPRNAHPRYIRAPRR